MRYKRSKKAFLALTIPILASSLCPFGVANADSRSEGFAVQDDYAWQQYRKTFDKEPAASSNLKANASTQEVQKYVKEALNSNSSLNEDIKIAGKKKNDDGSYSVAITWRNGEEEQKNFIVYLGADGDVTDKSLSMSDQALQAAYDEIVYGGGNELKTTDVISLNETLHTKAEEYISAVSSTLGISEDTAKNTAKAGAISLAGLAIMGTGVSIASSKVGSKASSKTTTGKTTSVVGNTTETIKGGAAVPDPVTIAGLVDTAFAQCAGRVSPYGALGCANTVVYTGSYYNADLKAEYELGTADVPTLVSHLTAKGYECCSFDGTANKGDLLIYGDDNHVVIADGEGGCFGNSSSLGYAKHYSDAQYAWQNGCLPSKIVKMS